MVQANPDRLFCSEIRMTGPGPETRDDEAALKIFRVLSTALGNGLVVFEVVFLRLLEIPLLLVSEEAGRNESNEKSAESKVGDAEGIDVVAEGSREHNEVCGCCDCPEEERLRRRDEGYVEEKEEDPAVGFLLEDFPAIVFRTDLVASFAPVVVGQADL